MFELTFLVIRWDQDFSLDITQVLIHYGLTSTVNRRYFCLKRQQEKASQLTDCVLLSEKCFLKLRLSIFVGGMLIKAVLLATGRTEVPSYIRH